MATKTKRLIPNDGERQLVQPRYPIYIPSKGRANHQLTANCLMNDSVPFHVVVEAQDAERYAEVVGEDRVLVLPFANLGQGSIPARNWIKEHAVASGAERHWQIDDNIKHFRRTYRGKRPSCRAGFALRVCEDFTDRYQRVALSGPAYSFFVTQETRQPFAVNVHVYSCTLVSNEIPHLWRGRYNEDTDLCLQVLADGWFTIQLNAVTQYKMPTMTTPGGNTEELYAGDGRLRMARALERRWPGVVRVDRRFQRPQHVVDWRRFKRPLERRDDIDFSKLPAVDEYGTELKVVRPLRNERLRDWVARQGVETEVVDK